MSSVSLNLMPYAYLMAKTSVLSIFVKKIGNSNFEPYIFEISMENAFKLALSSLLVLVQ